MKTSSWIIIGGLTGLVGRDLIRNPPNLPKWMVDAIDQYNADVLRRKQQLQLAEQQARLQEIVIPEFKTLKLISFDDYRAALAEQNTAALPQR